MDVTIFVSEQLLSNLILMTTCNWYRIH